MLDKLRKPGRAKNMFATVIFGAICLTFVFFGITPDGPQSLTGGTAAIVNGQIISVADYRVQVQRAERQMGFQLNSLPEAQRQLFYRNIRQRALEQLIQSELITQIAEENNILASDKEVQAKILQEPYFQENGKFKHSKYEQLLQANRLTPGDYEEQIRKDIMRQKMQLVFQKALVASQLEVDRERELNKSKINIGFLELDKVALSGSMKVSDNEFDKYLADEKNKTTVKTEYESNLADYKKPEEVDAQHILIKFDSKDSGSEQKALNKIKSIAEEAKSQDFGNLAKKYSEDTGSAKKGGSLGVFGRGRMVKPFEEAVFALEEGKISEPVKSQFGYHIIKLHRKWPERTIPLEEVEKDIAIGLIKEGRAKEAVGKIKAAFEAKNMSEVNSTLSQLGLKWQETGPFGIKQESIPKLGDNEKLIQEALKFGQTGQMIPNVIESRGKQYLVKLINVESVEDKASDQTAKLPWSQQAQFLAFAKLRDAFENWFEKKKETAIIQRNDLLLQSYQ